MKRTLRMIKSVSWRLALTYGVLNLQSCGVETTPSGRVTKAGSSQDGSAENSAANPSNAPLPGPAGGGSTPGSDLPPQPPMGDAVQKSKILGTNLTEIKDWSGEFPFVDVMKVSRGWFSGNANQWTTNPPTPVNLDANGGVLSLSPGQWLRTRILQGNVTGSVLKNCEAANGEYTVLYNGDVTFMAFEGASIVQGKSSPGRLVVNFDCLKGSLDLAVVGMTAGPMTDMKVIMPGGSCQHDATMFCKSNADCGVASTCEMFTDNYASRPFHPRFLNNIKKFSSIRFMDWMLTNNSTQQEWANRPQMSHFRWSEKGAPLEIMIHLANTLDVDPWFNIPERASDDYVAQFARVVKTLLKPGRKAVIEYTNEAWNGVFESSRYVVNQGNALNLGGQTSFENGMRFYSKRSVEIFNIFTREMGGNDRIVRALAGQAANLGVAMAILNYGQAHQSADAYAIAPYFHSTAISEGQQAMTAAQAIADLRAHAVPEAIGWVQNHVNYVNQLPVNSQTGKKLEVIAYEGGQHLVSSVAVRDDPAKAQVQVLLDEINRHPDMKTAYLEYLNGWKAASGKQFVHFNNALYYSKYGRWGSMENQFMPRAESPKYDALMEFIESGN